MMLKLPSSTIWSREAAHPVPLRGHKKLLKVELKVVEETTDPRVTCREVQDNKVGWGEVRIPKDVLDAYGCRMVWGFSKTIQITADGEPQNS